MKKSYEELQKKIEQLSNKFGECRAMIDDFDEQFDNDDYERLAEIQELDEQLNEEEVNIYGKPEENPDSAGSRSCREDHSLQAMKKDIITKINSLVNQFNENNKLIKD